MLQNKCHIFLILLIVCVKFSFSQLPNLDVFGKLYPNTSAIYLNVSENTEIKIIKNKLSIIKHNVEEILILKSNLAYKSKKIRTDDFIKASNIKATVSVLNGKKYKKKRITNIDLKGEHDDEGGVFYDDSHYYNINFADVKDGDIVTITYDEEFIEPHFYGSFYAGEYLPVIKSTLTLSYPNALVDLKIKEFNNRNLIFNKTEVQDKNNLVINYTFDSIKPITNEDYDPSYKHKASYILLSIKNYKTKDSTVEVCGSLQNLYNWNNGLLKDTDIGTEENLVKLVDSLTAGITDELKKVEKIYYWVQTKIAYLAYEDGLGGYVPCEASLVCSRKFGDCKDMANLIVKLGKIAKLPIYHTWIGTNSIQHQFTEFPAPSCANHMIAAYVSKTDTIFLDATGKFYPFKTPTTFIQSKEGLIGIDKKNYIVAKVPIIKSNINYETDSIVLNIENSNILKGKGFFKIDGYGKITLCNALDKKSLDDQKKYFNAYFQKGNNKFVLDSFSVIQNIENKPLIINYSFTIADYITQSSNLTLLNLNFNKDYCDKLSTKNRKYDLSFSYALTNKLIVNIAIPNQYKIDFVPENSAKNNSLVAYNINYFKTQNNIIFSNTISINKIYVANKDFKMWDEVIENYKKTKSNLISLTLK